MKWIHRMFALALFTASFDTILVVSVGGTLRFAQVMMMFVIVAAVAMMVQRRAILWPKGGSALLLWYCCITAFEPLSGGGRIGILLHLSLTFMLVGLYAVLQLYGRSAYLERMIKVYLWSFVFVASFGLIQFLMPPLHLGSWLINEWIIHGRLGRISGFSYEPSFFATYMIVGWIMLVDLRYSGARIVAATHWKWMTIGVGVVLFLSTSKTAWIFMMVELTARLWQYVRRGLGNAVDRLSIGSLKIPLPRIRVALAIAAGTFCVVLALNALNNIIQLGVFLNGTGLNNTASHSVSTRYTSFRDTVDVIVEQPLLGRSLGGVPARIAERHGATLNSIDDLRNYWGFPVIVDVLAASGVIAFLPFLWFFYTNTIGEFGLIRAHWPEERAKWMRALVRALLYECLALLVDQNILRVYFWFHVTIVVVVGFNLRYCEPEPAKMQIADAPQLAAV